MRFILLLGASLVTFCAHSLEAQESKRAAPGSMVKFSFTEDKQRLAVALKTGDMKFLNATPEQFLEAFQIVDPAAGLQSVSQLYEYVMSLTESPCPSTQAYFSRITPNHVVKYTLKRQFENGEVCLYRNHAVLSTKCGNVILLPRNFPTPGSPEGPAPLKAYYSAKDSVKTLRDSLSVALDRAVTAENKLNLILSQKDEVEIRVADSVWVQMPGFTKSYSVSGRDVVGRTTLNIVVTKSLRYKAQPASSGGIGKTWLILSNLLSAGAGFGGGFVAGSAGNVKQSVLVNGSKANKSPQFGLMFTIR